MYRGFNLIINSKELEKYYELGKELYRTEMEKIGSTLYSFYAEDGSLNASKMQENWFPQVDAEVFISHSHKNERAAIGLAGWLNSNFEITSFIDSCVWGYSNKLLKLIDIDFCKMQNGNYDYDARNLSTSHVHMMLSTALAMMMDRCECVFFLNTPESLTPYDIIKGNGETFSPWIYFEIAMTKMIARKSPDEHRGMLKEASEEIMKSLTVRYNLDLEHLIKLNIDDLNSLIDKYEQDNSQKHPLDILYQLKTNRENTFFPKN